MKESLWSGKTIVITGSSSGIGEAILNKLLMIPCKIFALDIQPQEITQEKKAEVFFIQTDISSESSVNSASKKILSNSKQIDVLFNNAGITTHGRFDESKISVFKKTFDINFFGSVHLTLNLIESIKKAKGAIITTSTVSGLYGVPGRSAYSSSKSALHAVFESLRIELSEYGVRSIIFCPPYTKTNLRTSGLTSDGKKLNEAQYAGKILTPEEVALAMINAVENPSSRLVTMDKSGFFVKVMRLLSPSLLEKVMFKKLYKDFHH